MENDFANKKLELKWKLLAFFFPYFVIDSSLAKYFVQGIPLLILIDRSGKIIGRWKEYNKEQEEMIDKKLAEVFNEN